MKDFKTKYAKVAGLGSAHHGVSHWIHQRVTAIANLLLILWFVYSIFSLIGASYLQANAWLASPINGILMGLLVISTFYHAKLGLQVVIEDYIHCKCMKIASLIAMNFVIYFCGFICLYSIFKVAGYTIITQPLIGT